MHYNFEEERANTISHGIGIVYGLVALPFLPLSGPMLIYSFCFLFLFCSSTSYHASKNIGRKIILQRVDHVSIYFMIAGSYTPFIFSCLEGINAWMFFGFMWSIVLLGTIFKLFFMGRFRKLSLILYLAMGWMVVFIAKPFYISFDARIIGLVILGGIFYTGGTYFYANDNRKYYHLIWHIFVLGGAISHFWAIALLLN